MAFFRRAIRERSTNEDSRKAIPPFKVSIQRQALTLEETLRQQRLDLKTVRDPRPSATHRGIIIIDPICC
jgi:hypothetical protein